MSLDPRIDGQQDTRIPTTRPEPPALEPEFPWRRLSFDPFFFGVERTVEDLAAEREG